MTINNGNTLSSEQINKKEVPELFFLKLKTFLEKDEYNLFQTRSRKKLNKSIRLSENKIQRLLDLKIKSEKVISQLEKKEKNLKSLNIKIKKQLIESIQLETE